MNPETKKKIVDIVKKMNSQGMSVTQITENLKQMEVPDKEIEGIIRESQPEVNIADVHEKAKETNEMLGTGAHLKPAIKKLEDHTEHFERLHTTVGDLHEKHHELSSKLSDMNQLKQELDEIKELLLEIKPLLASIERLNKNILETNKKMLAKVA